MASFSVSESDRGVECSDCIGASGCHGRQEAALRTLHIPGIAKVFYFHGRRFAAAGALGDEVIVGADRLVCHAASATCPLQASGAYAVQIHGGGIDGIGVCHPAAFLAVLDHVVLAVVAESEYGFCAHWRDVVRT
jgi:hypothetical protein